MKTREKIMKTRENVMKLILNVTEIMRTSCNFDESYLQKKNRQILFTLDRNFFHFHEFLL